MKAKKAKPRKPRPYRKIGLGGAEVLPDGQPDIWLSFTANAAESRRLAAWLLKYAAWREARDAER